VGGGEGTGGANAVEEEDFVRGGDEKDAGFVSDGIKREYRGEIPCGRSGFTDSLFGFCVRGHILLL